MSIICKERELEGSWLGWDGHWKGSELGSEMLMLGCVLYCMLPGEEHSSCSYNLEGWRSLRAVGPCRPYVHLVITVM